MVRQHTPLHPRITEDATREVPVHVFPLRKEASVKDLLLSLSLLTVAFLFLEGSLLFGVYAQNIVATAAERTPLRLSIRHGLTDTEIQRFLALLSQLPEVRHVRFVTKERAKALLQEQYPEHLPFLEASVPSNVLSDTAELTVRSSAQVDTLLHTLLRPLPSSMLDPSFLTQVEGWERLREREASFWKTSQLFAVMGVLAAFFLLSLLFQSIMRASFLLHASLLSLFAFLVATTLVGSAVFLF